MDLRQYVESMHHQLAEAAEAGGDETRALAERLVASLDAAIRLTLQDVLAAAAEEITCELAPGSVELRLRGRDIEFVVTPSPVDSAADDRHPSDGDGQANGGWAGANAYATAAAAEADDGAMARINLRMPDQLKTRIEQAAGAEGLSVNAWLVRAATAALERADIGPRPETRPHQGGRRFTGWAR